MAPATDPALTGASEWARAAAALPLAFAQVREDPQLDLHLVRQLPPSPTVIAIASGGETAVQLGREPLGALHLVDMNPAQLALTRLKWELAGTRSPDVAAAILGHLPLAAAERGEELNRLFARLGLDRSAFGPFDFVSLHGPDQAGRYERNFAALQAALAPEREGLESLLQSDDPKQAVQLAAPETKLGAAIDAAFDAAMSLPNFVQLFGLEATQNPRRTFASHFAQRTRVALARGAANANPFLWQIFAGRFPHGRRYDWLQEEHGAGTPCCVAPILHRGRMNEVLDSLAPRSADLVHLSNILDWLSPAQAQVTLASASRALKPGGLAIVRQLNSTLEIPSIPGDLDWDLSLGARLEASDRSFFYPGVFVGVRR